MTDGRAQVGADAYVFFLAENQNLPSVSKAESTNNVSCIATRVFTRVHMQRDEEG